MPLLLNYKRTNYFLKLTYLIGIITIGIILYILLPSQSLNVAQETIKTSPDEKLHKGNQKNYELTLHNSTFTGVNKDLEPYVINAETANKISENKYNLEHIDANYKFGNNKLLINAKNGLLDNINNWMDLKDDVQIFLDNLMFNTKEIHVNLITKEALSKVQVEVLYKNSQIKADSFISKDNSNIVNFKGNVITRINISDF